jgi:hypothetical protein
MRFLTDEEAVACSPFGGVFFLKVPFVEFSHIIIIMSGLERGDIPTHTHTHTHTSRHVSSAFIVFV